MKLSILIPAYNPGEWLRKILETLKPQLADYPQTETVIVDDGSTEDLSWVMGYPGVRLIRKTNGGEPSARNMLIKMAAGEYIQFIDADDEISENCLSLIYDNINAGFDFISWDWTCDHHREWAVQNKNALMINCAVWAYTFRRAFIYGTWFNESLLLGCDTDWLPRVLRENCKHRHDDRIWYNYRWTGNESSLCHRKLRGELQ